MPASVFAVLTSPGRGAIATIAVSGADAVALVARRFALLAKQPLETFLPGSVVVGRFQTAAGSHEELVVGVRGPTLIEINCHGGRAAMAAICESLVADGALLLTVSEWARQAESDALRAAALVALADARTARTAAVLLDQYRGALGAALLEIERLLDSGDGQSATAALEELRARTDFGLHLTHPWKIVLAGAPNAGKSSLMNALVGFQRSIVFAEPGTTRDVLSATTAIDGWPVELLDTAGLRESSDSLEAAGVARAEGQIARANLVIFVADTAVDWDESLFQHVHDLAPRGGRVSPKVLIAHHKTDLGLPRDGRPRGLATSALTGLGIEELCTAVIQALIPQLPPRGAAVPFTDVHLAALQSAVVDASRGALHQARHRLSQLTRGTSNIVIPPSTQG